MREIKIEKLSKKYGSFEAVKAINLTIKEGEIFGFIGPNGAGKTTILECIMGLRKLSGGSIDIFNCNVEKEHKKLIRLVGAQLQESALPNLIKVSEAIQLQAAIFNVKPDIRQLLEESGLTEKRNTFFSKLSGGQKQKLFILLAKLHNPEVLIFDELSTGLDPVARSQVWKEIIQLKERGKTVLISTHYMEEADYVCDRIALIDKGNIAGIGSPKELVESLPFKYVASCSKTGVDMEKFRKSFYDLAECETKKITVLLENDIQKNELLDMEESGQIEKVSLRTVNLDDYYQYNIDKEHVEE
jgi:ABC-2 type transport system ATP-binding protein